MEEAEIPQRKIIHVDMDAFYASVAQLDDPSLVGKPIAVGGGGNRGVVSAASYEARKFGVRSAMAGALAAKLCPELIFVKSDFDRYREISEKVRNVFFEYTDLVEPLSLDEAYLDVTKNKKGNPSASLIALEIRAKIKERTGLNASAGISVNKFIAKVASDINKPNGQKTVPPEDVLDFVEGLDIKKFYGVGKVMKEKMYRHGIYTGQDLKGKTLEFLTENFGKSGAYYYDIVRGIHDSQVTSERTRKSLAAERTFSENISSEIFMLEKLEFIAEEVERRLKKSKVAGRTVTLKIKYSDFTLQTRSKTLALYIADKDLIMETVKELLFQEGMKNSVRLLGISMSNLNNEKKEVLKISEEKKYDVQLKLDF
jgi:DNA polymerase-4